MNKEKMIINDKEIALELIFLDQKYLKYLSDDLKKDKDFMLQVIKINIGAIKYVADELFNDEEFIEELVNYGRTMLEYINKRKNFERLSRVYSVVQNRTYYDQIPLSFEAEKVFRSIPTEDYSWLDKEMFDPGATKQIVPDGYIEQFFNLPTVDLTMAPPEIQEEIDSSFKEEKIKRR